MDRQTYKFVEVIWWDAVSISTWQTLDDLIEEKPARMVTRGWLIIDDPKHIILAGTHDCAKDEFGEVLILPRGMVANIRDLNFGFRT